MKLYIWACFCPGIYMSNSYASQWHESGGSIRATRTLLLFMLMIYRCYNPLFPKFAYTNNAWMVEWLRLLIHRNKSTAPVGWSRIGHGCKAVERDRI